MRFIVLALITFAIAVATDATNDTEAYFEKVNCTGPYNFVAFSRRFIIPAAYSISTLDVASIYFRIPITLDIKDVSAVMTTDSAFKDWENGYPLNYLQQCTHFYSPPQTPPEIGSWLMSCLFHGPENTFENFTLWWFFFTNSTVSNLSISCGYTVVVNNDTAQCYQGYSANQVAILGSPFSFSSTFDSTSTSSTLIPTATSTYSPKANSGNVRKSEILVALAAAVLCGILSF